MHQASVGFHCPECLASEHTRVVTARGLHTDQPVLTIVLIVVNVAVWVVGQIIWRSTNFFTTSNEAVTKLGLFADQPTRVAYSGGRMIGYTDYAGVAHGEWYRLLTGGFVHANIIHLGLNMWMLYILGRILEQQLGRSRLGLIYFVSLFAGSLGALLWQPDSVTIGASGAIFGLMGAALAIAKARGIALHNTGLLGVVVINLVITFGMSSYISVGAHVGGLIGGAIAGIVIVDLPERMHGASRRTRAAVSWVGGVVLSLIFIAGAIAFAEHTADSGHAVATAPAVARVVVPDTSPAWRGGVGLVTSVRTDAVVGCASPGTALI